MKQLITRWSLLVFTSLSTLLMAQQNQGHDPWADRITLSAGLGAVPSSYMSGKPTQPPLEAALEYRFNKKIGIGAAYSLAKYQSIQDDYGNQWQFNSQLIAIRALAHITRLKQYDFYGGLLLGGLHQKTALVSDLEPNMVMETQQIMQSHGVKPQKTSVLYSAVVGAKRYLGKRVMLYAEAGFGLSMLSAGIGYNIRN